MVHSLPSDFTATFTGDIVTPGDGAAYATSVERWAANAARQAAVIVYPKSAADIALVLKTINLPLAIRGGGHSASGASSCENGLVIDLSRFLNGVRIDPEAKHAYVGGGAVWRTVDEEAMKYGLATVGGTVNHTGASPSLQPGGSEY